MGKSPKLLSCMCLKNGVWIQFPFPYRDHYCTDASGHHTPVGTLMLVRRVSLLKSHKGQLETNSTPNWHRISVVFSIKLKVAPEFHQAVIAKVFLYFQVRMKWNWTLSVIFRSEYSHFSADHCLWMPHVFPHLVDFSFISFCFNIPATFYSVLPFLIFFPQKLLVITTISTSFVLCGVKIQVVIQWFSKVLFRSHNHFGSHLSDIGITKKWMYPHINAHYQSPVSSQRERDAEKKICPCRRIIGS